VFVAAVAFSVTASMAPAYAQAPLPVPYLPQTEALCGGAAAAMVMRFWGARGVYADAFASLVDKKAGGIHTSALSAALESRGWRAQSGGGDLSRLSNEVRLGRPVIALIEDRPGRFHYVVVVSASDAGPIVIHDPARAPSRAIDANEFDRKWQRSDRWMLVLLPGAAEPRERPEPRERSERPESPRPCATTVNQGVALAQRGDTDSARRVLNAAAGQCPDNAAAWRELAGIDALDQRWDEAARHARTAVERDPNDDYAWRLLATAEYLRHHDLAALAAWNHVDQPRVDLIDIKGLVHTRYLVVADAIGVKPRAVLTPDAVRVAQARVRDIPAISAARITFHPLERGDAQVDATIVERERAPMSYPSWLTIGVGAAANSELAALLTNVSGEGDAVDVAWRWWANRPRVAASYAAPGPWGTWRLETSRETQTFATTRFEETRTRIGGELSKWLDQRVRVTGGLAMDRWHGRGRTTAISGRLQLWPVLDRVSIETGASGWHGSGARFGIAEARARWRSKSSLSGTVLVADAGYERASASSPASLWPGADTGHARNVLLRAHPLLDDGVIEGGVFGRRMTFGSVEAQRWLRPSAHGLVRVAPAIFLDTARASRGLATTNQREQYDLGIGLRLTLPGTGVLRVDVARGLRDGRTALSFGLQR